MALLYYRGGLIREVNVNGIEGPSLLKGGGRIMIYGVKGGGGGGKPRSKLNVAMCSSIAEPWMKTPSYVFHTLVLAIVL